MNIFEEFCKWYGVSPKDVNSKSRKPELVDARYIFALSCVDMGMTYTETGAFIGRDHSSVSHYTACATEMHKKMRDFFLKERKSTFVIHRDKDTTTVNLDGVLFTTRASRNQVLRIASKYKIK